MSCTYKTDFAHGPHRVDTTAFVAPGSVASDVNVISSHIREISPPELVAFNADQLAGLKIKIQHADRLPVLSQEALEALIQASEAMIERAERGDIPDFV